MVDESEFLASAVVLTSAQLLDDVDVIKSRLYRIRQLHGTRIAGRQFMATPQSAEAGRILEKIDVFLTDRDMHIVLSRPLESEWHVDYAAGPEPSFRGGRWLEGVYLFRDGRLEAL